MNRTPTLMRTLVAASSLALAAAAAASSVPGSGPVDREAVQAQYQADRRACPSGQTLQASRSACLYDAQLARQAALAGVMGDEDPAVLARNRTLRCDALPDDAEPSCLRLMKGQDEVTGSVEQGLILREPTVDLPVAAATQQTDDPWLL